MGTHRWESWLPADCFKKCFWRLWHLSCILSLVEAGLEEMGEL